ncbi:HNH endonuclease [Orbus wheelerorum]|uniref:HNH endonuclease n=1 Tax=Orbus wheelerorum TaxID=3074111 RepID=UPI00370D9E0B
MVKVKPIATAKPQQLIKAEDVSISVENITKNQQHVVELKNADGISKDLLKTKPSYSPEPTKWLEKGGKVKIEDNIWIYTNKNGKSIIYETKNINGSNVYMPNFKNYLHPNKNIAQVDIGKFSGNRNKDIQVFLEKTGLDEIPSGYTLHHSQPNGIVQLVETAIHREFTHIGGHSLYN